MTSNNMSQWHAISPGKIYRRLFDLEMMESDNDRLHELHRLHELDRYRKRGSVSTANPSRHALSIGSSNQTTKVPVHVSYKLLSSNERLEAAALKFGSCDYSASSHYYTTDKVGGVGLGGHCSRWHSPHPMQMIKLRITSQACRSLFPG